MINITLMNLILLATSSKKGNDNWNASKNKKKIKKKKNRFRNFYEFKI